MKLYHYTTWRGQDIQNYKRILPSNRYNTSCNILLTFLTISEDWEPSIQAQNYQGYYEKCGSHPSYYDEELLIPCWKFQVSYKHVIEFRNFVLNHVQWDKMMLDAVRLGSNLSDWYVTHEMVNVIKSWKWKGGDWQCLD